MCLEKKSSQYKYQSSKEEEKVTDALATLEFPVEKKVSRCQRTLLKDQENISKNMMEQNAVKL